MSDEGVAIVAARCLREDLRLAGELSGIWTGLDMVGSVMHQTQLTGLLEAPRGLTARRSREQYLARPCGAFVAVHGPVPYIPTAAFPSPLLSFLQAATTT